MSKKNPLITELREMGVTDYQRRKIRELEKEYQSSDAYKKIEQLNYELLGERVRPVTMNYDTAIKLLKYNIYGNIQSVIKEYQNTLLLVEQGTTKEYEDYINSLAEELQDIGVTNATPETLKSADLKGIEFWYSEYQHYQDSGNEGGMFYTRQKIEGLLGA